MKTRFPPFPRLLSSPPSPSKVSPMDDSVLLSPSANRDTTDTVDHTDPNLSSSFPPPSTPLPFSSDSSPSSLPTAITPLSPPLLTIPPPSNRTAFSSYFSLPSTAAFLLSHNSRRVALQFPDVLLPFSPHISQFLSTLLPPTTSLYILADTSYAPCCVDITAAQHCNADAIIHYGLACLSTSYSIPTHFVFGQAPLLTQPLYDAIALEGWEDRGEEGVEKREDVLAFCDVEFEWKMPELKDWVRRGAEEGRTRRRVVVASVRPSPPPPPSQGGGDEEQREQEQSTCSHCIAGHEFSLPPSSSLSSFVLLFIGSPSSPFLSTLMLTYNDMPTYLYDPSTPSPSILPSTSSPAIRRLLSRRFYLTQHALSSRIIGLLIGVVSHQGVLPVIERMQRLIRAAGKKSYVVAVGKVNPSKLANFSDIDVWCLISCPYAAILPDGGQGILQGGRHTEGARDGVDRAGVDRTVQH